MSHTQYPTIRFAEASISNFQIATGGSKTFYSLPHHVPITPSFKKLCQSANENYYLWFEDEKVEKSWSWKSRQEQKVEVEKRNQIQEKRRSYIKELTKCFLKYNNSFHAVFTFFPARC